MKLFKEVEKTRIAYHNDHSEKTVHRSSLLAPRFEHAATVISFLNHFLIKRNYKSVTLKITAINKDGNYKDSKSILINEPKVYTFFLEELFEDNATINEYLIEFFSTNNLFIPFPAVMINHVGRDFINTVHAYNRILNDIFEDDEVNSFQVCESSIDVLIDEEYDSFFNHASGQFDLNDTLKISLDNSDQLSQIIPVNMKRLSNCTYNLSEIFDNQSISESILKILQPNQTLFYGRLLSGVINRKTGAFSANHSYYDTSLIAEYFDSNLSARCYPYFPDQQNCVTMYPIVSKSMLDIAIEISDGSRTFKSLTQKLQSPSKISVKFNVNELVKTSGLSNVSSFKVYAYSDQIKIPTRVSHQVVYSALNSKSKLNSSINVSLNNEKVFDAVQKASIIWGQVVVANAYESRLGICFSNPSSPGEAISIDFYSQTGILKTLTKYLDSHCSLIFDSTFFASLRIEGDFVWYVARSKSSQLNAMSFHFHQMSENASGEHSF